MGRILKTSFALITLVAASAIFTAAQTASEYSEKDKKKMAEIAQRPEIAQRIEQEWAIQRRKDMQLAYSINSSLVTGSRSSRSTDAEESFGPIYNNPILLRHVNALGQRLVPRNSPNLYSFRLLLDPVPRAEALSTGTVYVSTGLVALLDNEAQLAYVLGHEISHIERKHHYTRIRNEILEDELMKEKESDAQKKRGIFSAIAAGVGAGIGAGFGGGSGALIGGAAGLGGGYLLGKAIFRNRFEPTEWSKVFEDEADEDGLRYMLEQNYDAREVPKMYARLDNLVGRDSRAGLGFIGNPQRVRERTAHVQNLLTTTYKADMEQRMKDRGLTGSSPEFSLLMSALRRDNGIIALQYDLFPEARDNLEEAARLRSNDPRVHYYLGVVYALTGRTPEEKQQAMASFRNAIQYDAERGSYPEPHLEEALYLIAQNNPAMSDEIKAELKTYVALYQREHGGALPGNMHILYDYFLLAGDKSWYVPPAAVVSTQNVEALHVTSSDKPSAATAKEVVDRATGKAAGALVPAADRRSR